jgi:hypothetical protein
MESDAPEEQVWRQIGLENKIVNEAEASEIAVMYSKSGRPTKRKIGLLETLNVLIGNYLHSHDSATSG